MNELSTDQKTAIKEILKTADNETRLIELKQYLSDFADTLDCDYAQLAYNIYIGDLMANNNDPKQI